MEDPDHGKKPSVSGASAEGRAGDHAGSRPSKGKRRRRKSAGHGPVDASQTGKAGEAGRPLSLEPVRKRKRRRGAKSTRASQASPGAEISAAVDVAVAALTVSLRTGETERAGQSPKSDDRRGRGGGGNKGRGLQGRPLKPEHKSGTGPSAPEERQRASVHAQDGRPQGVGIREPHRAVSFDAQDAPAPLYAALDLGTNNCRLLIAQPTRPGSFRVVDAFSRIVRLGEGLAATGRLSEEAMERSIEALKICAAKLAARDIRRTRLIATEAARAAVNGEAFMERVRAETGLDFEIINRETEARLAVSGCSSLVGRETRSVVLFDIGGGSSEIAVIRIGDKRFSRLANHITHWTSLPVGVVTLSERHGGQDVTPESFEAMVAEVDSMLSGFDSPSVDVLASGPSGQGFHLLGTSGTVTTLAGVHLDLPRYDRRKVDGVWLSDDEVSAMQARLLSWSFAERAANPCIGPDRADLVLAGCAILESIRRRWPAQRMRVADRGLREGLLTDMMADDGAWRNRPRWPRPDWGQPMRDNADAARRKEEPR